MAGAAPIWLYDGVCVLCSSAVRFLLRHERAPLTRFIAIQSDEGRALARSHGIDPDNPATFLWIENGAALEKSDGMIALTRQLRFPWSMAAGARLIPKFIRDSLYDLIARNRYRLFGRRAACEAPPPGARERFVMPRTISG